MKKGEALSDISDTLRSLSSIGIVGDIVGHDGNDDEDCSLLVRRSVPDDQAEQETDSACYKIGHPPALSLFFHFHFVIFRYISSRHR